MRQGLLIKSFCNYYVYPQSGKKLRNITIWGECESSEIHTNCCQDCKFGHFLENLLILFCKVTHSCALQTDNSTFM